LLIFFLSTITVVGCVGWLAGASSPQHSNENSLDD
jgi:hypothetical protein